MNILICLILAIIIFSSWLHAIFDTGICHAIFDTDNCHAIFDTDDCHAIFDTDNCHAILDTWHLTPALGIYTSTQYLHRHLACYTWYMLYLTHDIWYRYLPCYNWPMISDTGTCHAILDTWYITLVLDMLYLTPDTCITWHMHDYYIFTRHLVLLYLMYSWTTAFLNPWKRVTPDIILLLIPVVG